MSGRSATHVELELQLPVRHVHGQPAPEPSALARAVLRESDVLVRVDDGIPSEVPPGVSVVMRCAMSSERDHPHPPALCLPPLSAVRRRLLPFTTHTPTFIPSPPTPIPIASSRHRHRASYLAVTHHRFCRSLST